MRAKTGFVRRRQHKKILKLAKGFWMTRSKLFKPANEAVLHSGQYAFAGRRIRKRDLRKLWIVRINAALRPLNANYSSFIKNLATNNILLNRKILAELATNHTDTFQKVVNFVQVTKPVSKPTK